MREIFRCIVALVLPFLTHEDIYHYWNGKISSGSIGSGPMLQEVIVFIATIKLPSGFLFPSLPSYFDHRCHASPVCLFENSDQLNICISLCRSRFPGCPSEGSGY
jgi:hypothetical protein